MSNRAHLQFRAFETFIAWIRALQPLHGWGVPKYAWGAPLRKGTQGCITNFSHKTDTFYKHFLLAKMNH